MPNIPERPESGQQATRPRRRVDPPLVDVNALPAVIVPYAETMQLDRTKVDLIKRTICPPDTTDDELALFLHECQRRGVHPMDRLVIMQKRNDRKTGVAKVVFMTSIDYLRSRAEETGTYGGNDEPTMGPMVKLNGREVPRYADAVVYKVVQGVRCPFTARARWSEYYPGNVPEAWMWDRMPEGQLGKCAEAKALKKAFPTKLGGLYVPPELERPDDVDVTPPPPTPAPPPRGSVPAPAAPRGAPSFFTPTPQSLGDPEPLEEPGDDDGPVTETWRVVTLEAGIATETKGGFRKGQTLWCLEAATDDGGTVVAVTADQRHATTLQTCHEEQREFAMEWAERGEYDVIISVTPLS